MIRTLAVAVAVAVPVTVPVAVAAELIQLKTEMTKVRMYNNFDNFQNKNKDRRFRYEGRKILGRLAAPQANTNIYTWFEDCLNDLQTTL